MPVEINPEISGGKPVIMGTRITVEFILELLASGWSYEDLLENNLHLTKEDILDAIDCAASVMKEERVYLPSKKYEAHSLREHPAQSGGKAQKRRNKHRVGIRIRPGMVDREIVQLSLQ